MSRGTSFLVAFSLLIAGCIAQECNTVVETATNAGLTILLDAVKAAGLAETLNEPTADLTILAPTNEAFAAALEALDITAEDLLGNKELLTEILTYHVLPKARRAVDFGKDGGSFPTLLAGKSSCGKDDIVVKPEKKGVSIVGGETSAKVVTADVEACSTVIHVIDAVLLPCSLSEETEEMEEKKEVKKAKDDKKMKVVKKVKEVEKEEEKKCTTVVETAQAAGLNILLKAVTTAGLADTVNNPDAGLTIFAPTDKAFKAALDFLGLTAEQLLEDKDLLTTILTFHVLPKPYSAKQLLKGRHVDTLVAEGSKCPKGELADRDLSVRRKYWWFGDVQVIGKGSFARVKKADIKACSTIIHLVDFVLLPCDFGCGAKKCKPTKIFFSVPAHFHRG